MFGFVNSETRLKLAKLQAPPNTAVVNRHDPVTVRADNQKKLQIAVLCSEIRPASYSNHDDRLNLHLGSKCATRCGLGSL